MDPSNLVPLRQADISPAVIIQSLKEAVSEIREMYVVTLTDEGPQVYATGDLTKVAFAALVLQDVAIKYLNGEIENAMPDEDGAG